MYVCTYVFLSVRTDSTQTIMSNRRILWSGGWRLAVGGWNDCGRMMEELGVNNVESNKLVHPLHCSPNQ